MILSSDQVARYHEQGYLLAPGFFWAAKEDRALDEHSYSRSDGEGGAARLSLWNHPGDSLYGMFARSASLVHAAEALLEGGGADAAAGGAY